MEYVYRVQDDYDDYMAGSSLVADDPKRIGRVIRFEAERRQYEELRALMMSGIREAGGEMFVGDLLKQIGKTEGYDKMLPALCILQTLSHEGIAVMCEDTDNQRIAVSLPSRMLQ